MSEIKRTIVESWPALEEDLHSFLSDTDAWIISEIKTAYEDRDWVRVGRIIGIMEMVHNMSHSH